MPDKSSLAFLGHIRPTHLITSGAMYLLGAGFVNYLEGRLNMLAFLLGLCWLITLQLGMFFLGDYFNTPFDRGFFTNQELNSRPADDPDNDSSLLLLFTSVALLTGAAVFGIILGINGHITWSGLMIMTIYFLLHVFIVVPGISLDLSGVGEMISSIILVPLPPVLAYLLQVGEIHRLIILGVFPLFPLNLALILVMRLKRYKDDLLMTRKTLLIRLGWIQGIYIHNLLIFSGFLLFGLSLLFGMPFRLVGTVFLAIPVGIYLIWYLSNLEDGAPVRWPLITLLSLAVFFLPVYLFTYTVWIR